MVGGCRTARAPQNNDRTVGRAASVGSAARWIAAVLMIIALAGPVPVQAAGRYAAMVIDGNTGQVLHAEAADEPRYPASLTKMMTLYLVFEAMQQGRLTADSRIRVSAEAASVSPSKLGLEPGASIAVADAVKALITKSANDIAVALAEHLAGDETRFAALMTQRARELGMSKTTFRNAHGLPDRGQVTTARDMLTLALRLYDTFPAQARLFATRSFQFAGRIHRNHNTMLDNFQGLEGIKTGYTSASGFNLVASVRRDGKHVLAAVFGGTSAAARNARMRVMLSRGMQEASLTRSRKPLIVASGPALKRMPVPARRPQPQPRDEPLAAATPVTPAAPVAAPRSRPAPRLVEPVQPLAAPSPPAAAERQEWRSSVRVAEAPGAGTSVASQLGMTINPAASGQASGPLARPPSTLAAQASQLTARPVAVAAPAARPGEAHVQIGAYAGVAEARQRLASAQQAAPRQLAGAGHATPTVQVSGRLLYRARFTGLDPARASAACSELRRAGIDCLVARPE